MVHLHRIYTKSGDAGQTSLGDGTRVAKASRRVRAMGAVDEVNAALGVCLALGSLPAEAAQRLKSIQNDLFDLGADLCLPESDEPSGHQPLRIQASQVERLEHWIDAETESLQPLTSFILPGGTGASALLHQARTTCRRAEIEVIALMEGEPLNPQGPIYLNRLSDLLFVMARTANDNGQSDVLWTPGENR